MSRLNKTSEKNRQSWWRTQPVYPNTNQKPLTTIGNIPNPIHIPTNINIYRYDPLHADAVLSFINDNYIGGYILTMDYFNRKMSYPGSLGLVLMSINREILGFIYCQPIQLNNIVIGYVDLMVVSKKYRELGLAKILISNIVNLGGFDSYIHKKDSQPLPFPYFFKDRHYTIPLAVLKYRYGLKPADSLALSPADQSYRLFLEHRSKTANELLRFHIDTDVFRNTQSVMTLELPGNKIISIAIHHFSMGFIRNATLAEVFLTTLEQPDNQTYQFLIRQLLALGIDFLVILGSQSFFKRYIQVDNYIAGQELYLHSYNRYIPPVGINVSLEIPLF